MRDESHLSALVEKHHSLEGEIDTELHRPAPDQMRITTLKREKLRIKDEISRLELDAAPA